MRTVKTIVIPLVALVAVSACGKKKEGDSAGKAEDKTDKPAETKKASCPADYTKNEEGGFCFKMPADFKPRDPQKMGSTQTMYGYGNENYSVSFKVDKFEKTHFDLSTTMTKDTAAKAKNTSSGDLADGVGKFWVYDQDSDTYTSSITHGANFEINCATRIGTGDTEKGKYLDICKTVIAL